MAEIAAAFHEGLYIALSLWLALLVGMGYLFARTEAAQFILGLIRAALTVAYRPIAFIGRSVRSLARYGRTGDEYAESDQFLLNGLMVALQATIVVGTGFILAFGIVGAWKAVIPPKNLRDDVREARASLVHQRNELTQATSDVVRLDSEWHRTRDAEITKARTPHLQTIAGAESQMAGLEKTATEWGGSAANVISLLKERATAITTEGDEGVIRSGKNTLDRIVADHWSSMSDEDRSLAGGWINRWEQKVTAQYASFQVSDHFVRSQRQPTYAEAHERKTSFERSVAEKEVELQTLEKAASFRFGAATRQLAFTAFALLGTVWLYGLLLEGLWMLVRAAGDLKRIRVTAEQAQEAQVRARGLEPHASLSNGHS